MVRDRAVGSAASAISSLLRQKKIDTAVRYRVVEIDDALALAERLTSELPVQSGIAPPISQHPRRAISGKRSLAPDEEFIKALDRELQIFNFFLDQVMEKIRATYEVPVPQARLALKAAFRASLEMVP